MTETTPRGPIKRMTDEQEQYVADLYRRKRDLRMSNQDVADMASKLVGQPVSISLVKLTANRVAGRSRPRRKAGAA